MFTKQFLTALTLLILTATTSNSASAQAGRPTTFSFTPNAQSKEGSLASVRESDRESRDANNKMPRLSPTEHLRRASIYMANRAFEEARAHWLSLIDYYPEDPRVAEALLGIGRAYFQSRRYREAYSTFDRLARDYPNTKEGREGLNFSASALLRMGKPSESVDKYVEYITRFPNGERIDSAHLNVIDTLREAGRPQDAITWVAQTRKRFAGTPTDTNALFGRLRLDVAESNWKHAISTADELSRLSFQKGVLTTPAEVAYLKAYSLEQAGSLQEAVAAYSAIPDSPDSYYGWLAAEKLTKLTNSENRSLISQRVDRVNSQIADRSSQYPIPYRQAILKTARSRRLDPRFILAIIKQESVFRPLAKSPAGARGLLQLTIDAAERYASNVGIASLRESQLYNPGTSILLGGEYLSELLKMFPNQLEAVAASYNGGEDNVSRWTKRARHKDPGVFTAEIGFEETKGYVQKVMANYRAYRQLYTAELVQK